MTIQEIEEIVNSDDSFASYVEGRESLRAVALDLLRNVMTIGWDMDGEQFSDEAMFELVQDIMEMYMKFERKVAWC